jgi:hypothetical protein
VRWRRKRASSADAFGHSVIREHLRRGTNR